MHSAFNESAFCQARARLPLQVLMLLLQKMTKAVRQTMDDPSTPGLWRGRRTVLIDGSGFSMPDTAALLAFFGLGPGQKPGCGFPVGHMLAIFDAATGLLLDLTIAAGSAGDLTLAASLRTWLRSGHVLVGDRGFCSFVHLAVLKTLGIDGVFRLHAQRKDHRMVRRKHRRRRANGNYVCESVLVRRISSNDQVVEWMRPAAAVAARQTKDDARDTLVAVIRPLVRRIQVEPVVTDAQRGALGISIRQSGGGGQGGPPMTRPLVSIDVTARLRHTIHFKDESTPTSKARPKNVMGAEVWVKLIPVGEPQPEGAEGLTFIATCTRTPCIADRPASGGGQNAHYMLRWVNRRGQTGPWSETASATVGD